MSAEDPFAQWEGELEGLGDLVAQLDELDEVDADEECDPWCIHVQEDTIGEVTLAIEGGELQELVHAWYAVHESEDEEWDEASEKLHAFTEWCILQLVKSAQHEQALRYEEDEIEEEDE
jgi:hypothetical protein